MAYANAPAIATTGTTKTQAKLSAISRSSFSALIRLARIVNCFIVAPETIRTPAFSNSVVNGSGQRAGARRALPPWRRRGVPGSGRAVQGSRVRPDCADRSGSIARRGPRAGRVPAGASRPPLLPRRGAALDVDLPDRRQRL